jgi:hypothetical protein
LYPHAAIPDRKRVGPHHHKILVEKVFDGIYGCKNTNQGHDTECNDQHSKDASKKVAADGVKGYPDVFFQQIGHSRYFLQTYVEKVNKLPLMALYLTKTRLGGHKD